jgi:Zn-dependent protease with chaperone function
VGMINNFRQCVSTEERRQRFGVTFVNTLLWILIVVGVVATLGVVLLFVLFGWFINYLLSEYNVRKVQALGATVSPEQLPQVAKAVSDVCRQFNVSRPPRVIVLSSGETNAFAMKFARKRVVLILSELLEGIIDQPDELRALLGHEIGHSVLDHGSRGTFEIYKPPRYRAARELSCDNAGYAASGDLQSTISVLKKLCVGNRLSDRLSEEALVAEADVIRSGFVGWLIRRNLTHPPAGTRVRNVHEFAREVV